MVGDGGMKRIEVDNTFICELEAGEELLTRSHAP